MLLAPYCNSSREFKELCQNMQEMKEKYRAIRISYTVGEPKTMEKEGALVVVQTDQSKVEMTGEQLTGIIEITQRVRNKLISGN
jgi:hypothetical protein